MDQIDDLSKRLSRPIKDLDDVRQAMATLREIREKEISIDSCLGPIEVSTAKVYLTSPGPSEIGHNSFISLKPLRPVDSS